MRNKIVFDAKSVHYILEALEKSTDTEGYVIDNMTREHVLDVDGNKFKPEQLIGILKPHWITSDSQLFGVVLQDKTNDEN